jgi:hypothetical protein
MLRSGGLCLVTGSGESVARARAGSSSPAEQAPPAATAPELGAPRPALRAGEFSVAVLAGVGAAQLIVRRPARPQRKRRQRQRASAERAPPQPAPPPRAGRPAAIRPCAGRLLPGAAAPILPHARHAKSPRNRRRLVTGFPRAPGIPKGRFSSFRWIPVRSTQYAATCSLEMFHP